MAGIHLLDGQSLKPLAIGVTEGELSNPVASLKTCGGEGKGKELRLSFDNPSQRRGGDDSDDGDWDDDSDD